MPPRAKFLKEEIIQAALSIVKKDGMSALTARTLGAKLSSSARPVFTVFQSMEEVRQCVIENAKAQYREYVEKGLSEPYAFKGVGLQYILFAVNEPKLFQLLFMNERDSVPSFEGVLPQIDESYHRILQSIIDNYGLTQNIAETLYRHLWIYTHGIATLCATKMCCFTDDEINKMLTEVFVSLLEKIGG